MRTRTSKATKAPTEIAPDEPLPLTERLVSFLQQRYPDKAPDVDSSDRDIWIAVGKVQVVRYLREQLELNQRRKD